MKLTPLQMSKIVEKILQAWKAQNLTDYKVDDQQVRARAIEAIQAEYDKETDLEKEVNKMLDQLERTNRGEFERYKMFPLLKQKLAKERKIIL